MISLLLAAGLLLPSPVLADEPPSCDALTTPQLDDPAFLDGIVAAAALSMQCVKAEGNYCLPKCTDAFATISKQLEEAKKKEELDAKEEAARAAAVLARDHLSGLPAGGEDRGAEQRSGGR